MSLNMFWFLPTHGDGHYLGSDAGARPVDHGYLQQIAQAADRLGFTGVLIPTGRSCEDAWLVAASDDPGDPVGSNFSLRCARPSCRRPWRRVRRRRSIASPTAARCLTS